MSNRIADEQTKELSFPLGRFLCCVKTNIKKKKFKTGGEWIIDTECLALIATVLILRVVNWP